MQTLSETLRTIHRLRRHGRELQSEIDRGPVQLKARQTFAAKQAKALADAKEFLKKLQVTVREREADLKSAHEQMVKYQRQLNTEVGDKRQFDALQHEISDTKKRCEELEETILTTMTQVDEQVAAMPGIEAAAAKAKSDAEAFAADTQTRLARFTEELARVQAETKSAEANLPPDVKVEYDRRISSYGADAMAACEKGCCGNCRTSLTAQTVFNVQQGYFASCPACFRLLYSIEAPAAEKVEA